MSALPRKQTKSGHLVMSALCQSRPNAPKKSAWFTWRIEWRQSWHARRGRQPHVHNAAGNLDCHVGNSLRGVSARQCLTRPTALGLLASPRGGSPFGRAARGSVAPRKMACRPAAGGTHYSGSRPSTRAHGRGGLVAAPFDLEEAKQED